MRELSISFFLLFLLFLSIDITTTSYSKGIRKALFEEIDYRLSQAASDIQRKVSGESGGRLNFEEFYPILVRYSLSLVELFDSKGNLIRSSDMKAGVTPEVFTDTTRFWGYRYGLFPINNEFILLGASEKYLKGLRNLFRISIILRFLIYPIFIGLGIYIFRTFSFPFKTVEEIAGEKGTEIEYTMSTIKEMAKDYQEKLKNLREREREVKQRLFLSRLGENVTQVLHEIRNSAGAILGFGKLVEDEEVKERLLDEATHLNRFSTHLLFLSSPLELERKLVNIKELILGVTQRIDNKGVKIETQIPEEISVEVDEELASEALYNTLDNSIDACRDGGEVSISVESKGESINIMIKDTGKGMDEETLSSMFDLFFTKKDGGIGIGMVLTKRIIEAHNGDIEVKSSPGKGTEVLINLPGGFNA